VGLATRVRRTVGLARLVHHALPAIGKFIRAIRNVLTAVRAEFHENVFNDCSSKGRHALACLPFLIPTFLVLLFNLLRFLFENSFPFYYNEVRKIFYLKGLKKRR
jgi:hypothetical protein